MARTLTAVYCAFCGAVHAGGRGVGRHGGGIRLSRTSRFRPATSEIARRRSRRGIDPDGLRTEGNPAAARPARDREFDQVLDDGLVPASAILVGDPGIGKSTLLLQAAAGFARNGLKVVCTVSGEATAGAEACARTGCDCRTSSLCGMARRDELDDSATLEAERPTSPSSSCSVMSRPSPARPTGGADRHAARRADQHTGPGPFGDAGGYLEGRSPVVDRPGRPVLRRRRMLNRITAQFRTWPWADQRISEMAGEGRRGLLRSACSSTATLPGSVVYRAQAASWWNWRPCRQRPVAADGRRLGWWRLA